MSIAKYALGALLLSTLGCGGDDGAGSGSLRVKVSAEDTISGGLSAGSGEEDTRDFGVTYTKYLVAIGRVKLARTDRGESREDPQLYVADLRQVGVSGVDLVKLDGLSTGQWDQFGYETGTAAADTKVLPGVSAADAQEMVAKQLTYWIEGTVDRPEKPVRFVLQVAAPTRFSSCESNAQQGVAVVEGGQSTSALTLHGDHLWFDSLPTGSEQTVMRRAAWLVQADSDGDGLVRTEDLAAVPAEQVFPSTLGYNLSGSDRPISTALDFVRAQLASQGHLDGEGECVWTQL